MGCPAEYAHAWMWVSSLLWGRHGPASGSPSLKGDIALYSENPQCEGRDTALALTVPQSEEGDNPALGGLPV